MPYLVSALGYDEKLMPKKLSFAEALTQLAAKEHSDFEHET